MRERYRKWGRTVRYEHGRLVRVDEAGEAIETSSLFLAMPLGGDASDGVVLPELDADAVVATAHAIEAMLRPERLLVSDGVAEHECNGIRWQERTRRLHLAAIIGSSERALLDLQSFELDVVRRMAAARVGEERAPRRLRIAPHLAASLLPHLLGTLPLGQAAAPHDGKGLPIVAQPIVAQPVLAEPPNWYRPSYRVRPRRLWLNLRPRPFGTVDPGAAEAIALLGGIDLDAQRLLCIDGGELFAATVSLRVVQAADESAALMI
jgi:hypothetical protein